ncbi:MAG: FAD-dependent oxidoreductase [Candidatus Verstraetearchaeota archaeon]|nr:FAD-dependent oxidoreductase [Candidatus Verstraetearchaeota archaeon]
MGKVYDVIIVGGGPAGLTAAVYARKRLMTTLVLTMDIGGQVLLTEHIDNYLGYLEKSGLGLAAVFERQAREYGAEFVISEVRMVEKEGSLFRVSSTAGDFLGRAVIVTGGRKPRRLCVPGEERFLGRGVNVSLKCDPSQASGKAVAIVGGGNTALQRAEMLSTAASRIYIVHRREEFRGDEMTLVRVRKIPNVEFLLNTVIMEFRGGDSLSSVLLKNLKTGEERELKVDMVFLDIGRDIKLEYVQHLVRTNSEGRIITDKYGRTSCEGIFAAGDVTDTPYAQVIIAAGQGAAAALTAYSYVKKKPGDICY